MTRRMILMAGALVALTACTGSAAVPAATPTATQPGAATITPTVTPAALASPSPSGAATTSSRVDVGGRSLYLTCQGTAQPTIILEAGLTGDHRTWERVMPSLPADVRVCAYDRANVPPSDPAPTPRTTQDMVDDLESLLTKASVAPPYVLVGFSFGGLAAQLYAAKHPTEIAGLVLVESNHPKEVEQFEAHLTAAQIKADREVASRNEEGVDVFASFDEVQAAGRLPAVPLVVVTATVSEGWPEGWDAATFDELRARQQRDLAALVPGGRQVFAEGSTHDVPSQRPDVIVDAIRTVLDAKP